MELAKIEDINLQYLDLWASNLVDNINYDLSQIIIAVPSLNMQLTNMDTSPIQYFSDELNEMIKEINNALKGINEQLGDFDKRLKDLEG